MSYSLAGAAWDRAVAGMRRIQNNLPVKRETEFQGIPVHIELDRGDTKSGTDPDGKSWTRQYDTPYGFIPGTLGADGEELDVYLGDNDAPGLSSAYVVRQLKKTGEFDEEKAILGATTEAEAKAIFDRHHSGAAWAFGGMETMTMDDFKKRYLQTPSGGAADLQNQDPPDVAGVKAADQVLSDVKQTELGNAGEQASIITRGGGAKGWVIRMEQGGELGPYPSYSAAEAEFKRREFRNARPLGENGEATLSRSGGAWQARAYTPDEGYFNLTIPGEFAQDPQAAKRHLEGRGWRVVVLDNSATVPGYQFKTQRAQAAEGFRKYGPKGPNDSGRRAA